MEHYLFTAQSNNFRTKTKVRTKSITLDLKTGSESMIAIIGSDIINHHRCGQNRHYQLLSTDLVVIVSLHRQTLYLISMSYHCYQYYCYFYQSDESYLEVDYCDVSLRPLLRQHRLCKDLSMIRYAIILSLTVRIAYTASSGQCVVQAHP